MKNRDHFDEDGKQIKPFSTREMSGSDFKVGEKVEYFKHPWDHDRGTIVGVIKEIRPGYGPYPSVWNNDPDYDGGGFWMSQHCAYIVVDFAPVEFGYSWKDGKKVPTTTRGFSVTDEGDRWKRI